MLANRLAWTAH